MEQLNKKLLNWASILDPKTQEQAELSSSMPFIYPHIALMPDAHLGKGATVGSVIPTLGAIMPAAIGVDIGCGMIAVQTQFTGEDFRGKDLAKLRESIEWDIPLSPGRYNKRITDSAAIRIARLEGLAENYNFNPESYAGNWREQLGSLGGGNHFIEVSVDEGDRVWLFLHSGSRGVGNKIATHHIKVAQEVMKKYYINLPDNDLAYLVEGTDEFWAYIKQIRWAQEFALYNREEMMDRVIRCTKFFLDQEVVERQRINCHHNFTEQAHFNGKNVWLSRKGAIDASEGVGGLIPGSMGTSSYVVKGKGNVLALNSSPHGAGRNFSRTEARRRFTQEDLQLAMKGIEFRDSEAFVDEIPQAYKDISVVMNDAADLVEIQHVLNQIVNVKGE